MALNRITLDVSGRLSLLGPQPEVLQILKRAGIHNILRIFDNETELIRTSEDIILQTSSFQLGELKNLAQQQEPQSEFDQLRSEIGSVFGSSSSDMREEQIPQPPKTKTISPAFQDSRFSAPQPPVASSIEQEFDDAFSQFETGDDNIDLSDASSNQYNTASQAVNYIPPPPPTRGVFNPAAGQFQNRQFMPQPPVAPVPPRPVVPQVPISDPVQKPASRQPADFGSRTDNFQSSAPATRSTQSVPPAVGQEEFDEGLSGRGRTSKIKVQDDSFDESDDQFFEEGKKKSPVPMLIIVVLLLALGGVGVYFAYNMLSNKPAVETPITSVPKPQTPVTPPPPVVVDTPKVAEPVNEPVKETPKENIVASKTESKPKESSRVATRSSKPKAEPRSYSRPSTPVSNPAPAVTDNKVIIASTPSGAKVTINGDYMGLTPYTWDKPIFGPLSVVVSKDGYEDDSKVFEFTGGKVRENFSLRKAAVVAPPPVTYSEPAIVPEPEPEPEPEPYTPPAQKYTPPAAEPEPVVRSTPEPTPVSSSFSGGEASIFIASIPPVADVFLDGKLVGKTNVSEIKLPAGTHNLKFVKGVKEATKAITVQPGKNPSQMVRLQ